MAAQNFIPGLELNEQFFAEVVQPLLAQAYPDLAYAAARLGGGSDVLGYDSELSTDHDWGIRMQLFLTRDDFVRVGTAVHTHLRHHLPATYRGFAVHFGPPDANGSRVPVAKPDGPISHRIDVTTVRQYVYPQLHLDLGQPMDAIDWLTIPQQLLLELTAGRVFTDPIGELTVMRQQLVFYPPDVWLYLLASQWRRISQEEHFVGRAGMAGDELGSRLLAARLVHDMMQLCFLMAGRYAPYAKWVGTAFAQLPSAPTMQPLFDAVLSAADWQTREQNLCAAYSQMATMHNELGITPPLSVACVPFHERPFRIIDAGRFVAAIRQQIRDPRLLRLSTQIGSIDQFSHSTDLRSYPALHRRLRVLYEE